MNKVTSLPVLVKINAFWIGLSFKWGAIHPIILPALLINRIPDIQKNTYLGLMTFLGLIIAMVVQPFSGALSDKWISRIGKRPPLILLGTILDFVFLVILGWSKSFLGLLIGYIGLQISSNMAHGSAQGIIPDYVPKNQLGKASGIKTLMGALGIIVASIVIRFLLGSSRDNYPLIFFMIMLVTVLSVFITIIQITVDSRSCTSKRIEYKVKNRFNLKEQFQINFHENIIYRWMIIERFVFLLGVYSIQQFAQYYIRDVIQVNNPIQVTSDLMASIALSLVILASISGWLTDKFGTKRLQITSMIVMGIGCIALLFARTEQILFFVGIIVGAGTGLFLTSNWAFAIQITPEKEAGKYLGLTNFATAGSAACARLWGPLLDKFNNAWPGKWYGYSGMFIFSAICALFSFLILEKMTYGSNKT